jgi:predicted P-loop ATPase
MISCWHGTYSLLVLVFVNSEHGTGKTKWIRNLLPPELQRYFAEAKMDGDKDHLALMASRLMLFDDEFSGKSRKEHSLLKELSAKQHITIRRPYAKRPERCLRVSVFSGSTNDESILSDPTGNRRILAFHMSAVDWEKYDAVDKTELLMELYHEWRNTGDAWMLTKEDIGILEQAHRPFNEVSPEEELLVKHFEFRRDGEMTNTDIINAMQGKLNGASIRLSQKKLGMVLKKLGHKTRWVKRNGKAAQVYDIDLVDTARVGDFVEKTALPF